MSVWPRISCLLTFDEHLDTDGNETEANDCT
jgi:hypothetical protein